MTELISPRLAALEAHVENTEKLLGEVARTQHDMAKTLAAVSAQSGAITNLVDQTGKQWDRIHSLETEAARTEEKLSSLSKLPDAVTKLASAVSKNSTVAKIVTSLAGVTMAGLVGFLFWLLRFKIGG
ncbi:hypothetical protein [Terasakiella sp.]|uniref:hypothetical protein n=1 Tax=Terasakiella sp. TaxID=2034861 RepID=UPI003AA92F86